MKRFRIFTNDRGGELYSCLCEVKAAHKEAALKLARARAFRWENAWAIEWPAKSEADKLWLKEHVG